MVSFSLCFALSLTVVVCLRHQGDKLWKQGVMSSGQSTTMRLLIPLSLGIDLFMKADMYTFLSQTLLTTKLGDFSVTQKETKVCWLNDKHDHPYKAFSSFLDASVVWTTFELSYHFKDSMQRIQLSAIARNHRTADDYVKAGELFLSELCDLVVKEKKRQMTAFDFDPQLTPWKVEGVMTMPFVIWVRTNPKHKRARCQ